MQPYSVLLTYPSDMTFGTPATFYAFVEAQTPAEAVALARAAALATPHVGGDPEGSERDYAVLLVLEGHHVNVYTEEMSV